MSPRFFKKPSVHELPPVVGDMSVSDKRNEVAEDNNIIRNSRTVETKINDILEDQTKLKDVQIENKHREKALRLLELTKYF